MNDIIWIMDLIVSYGNNGTIMDNGIMFKKMWTPFSACPVFRDFASTILKPANIHRILQKHCKDSLFAQDHACCTNSGTFHGMQTISQKPVCHARQKLNQKTRISHRVGCLWNPRQRHALCAVCRWEPKERKSCAAKGHCHQFSQMGHQKYHGHGDDSQRSCLVQNSMSGKLEETPVRNSQSSFTSVLTKDQRYTCAMVKPSDDGCAQNLHQIVTYWSSAKIPSSWQSLDIHTSIIPDQNLFAIRQKKTDNSNGCSPIIRCLHHHFRNFSYLKCQNFDAYGYES
jgi:hypothetical protein